MTDIRDELRAQLLAGLDKVPPGAKDWSWNTAVEFKATVRALRKIAAKQRASYFELSSAVNRLSVYWSSDNARTTRTPSGTSQ